MASMDIFNNSAFSMTSLTTAVNKKPYKPQLLGSLGIFTPKPSRTRDIWVERKNGRLHIVPTSDVGAPATKRVADKRDGTSFRTVRIAPGSRVSAEEVQGIRAFGSESELKSVASEVSDRMDDLLSDLELTEEHHRLGAINGVLLDADGTTVIEDFYDRFGIAKPGAVDFAFSTEATEVRNVIKGITRAMHRSAKGALPEGAQIHALCGDEFYDALTTHPTVEKFYLNYLAAQQHQQGTGIFGVFYFEGVYWHNYRGTDDNATVAVPSGEARFFPVGGRDVFQKAMAPAEFAPYVNTRGLPRYAMVIPDRDRQAYVDVEVYSYPLFMCTRPEVLRSATAS